MVTRREWLGITISAGAGMALGCGTSAPGGTPATEGAARAMGLITRPIPSSGEPLPIVGLGSSATFSSVARSEDATALGEVLQTMVDMGGKVFDTAPSYGASEEVAGRLAAERGLTDRIFWATKVNAVGRGEQTTTPEAARAQIESSFQKLRTERIDLIQVHNLADVPTQLGVLKPMKEQGRVRYIGVTTTSDNAYDRLLEVMRNEPIDFIGIDYAVDNRGVEEQVLPLALERKIGVLVYVPFGRTSLFARVGDRALPEWAKEFDASSWAQFFIKYAASHPAVTTVTPATSQPRHMRDNMGGAMGRLPNEAQRRQMVELVDALPPAPRRGRGG